MTESRLDKIAKAAEIYGERSFDNYAQIRSVAEQIRNSLCEYLDNGQECVFLVPPQGPFTAQNYRSAAFSVAGKGFLPLEPISFGLRQVIKGWTEGVQLMVVGEKTRFYIPSTLAYGNNSAGKIKPGELLIFDVELLAIN